MSGRGFALPKLGYGSASGWFLLVACLALLVADIAVTALDPWAEIQPAAGRTDPP